MRRCRPAACPARPSVRASAASSKLEDVPLFGDSSLMGPSSSSQSAASGSSKAAAKLEDVPLTSEVDFKAMGLIGQLRIGDGATF